MKDFARMAWRESFGFLDGPDSNQDNGWNVRRDSKMSIMSLLQAGIAPLLGGEIILKSL